MLCAIAIPQLDYCLFCVSELFILYVVVNFGEIFKFVFVNLTDTKIFLVKLVTCGYFNVKQESSQSICKDLQIKNGFKVLKCSYWDVFN